MEQHLKTWLKTGTLFQVLKTGDNLVRPFGEIFSFYKVFEKQGSQFKVTCYEKEEDYIGTSTVAPPRQRWATNVLVNSNSKGAQAAICELPLIVMREWGKARQEFPNDKDNLSLLVHVVGSGLQTRYTVDGAVGIWTPWQSAFMAAHMIDLRAAYFPTKYSPQIPTEICPIDATLTIETFFAVCSSCGGAGTYKNKPCRKCHGIGQEAI